MEAQAQKQSGRLRLRFVATGSIQQLLVPPRREPRFAHGLWRHTCFECFIAEDGEDAYREFNFSPSGEWAAYGFSGYRAGMTPLPIADPGISVEESGERLVLEASIPVSHDASLRCALTAVVEPLDGGLSYWALAHGPGRPDFHRREGFILSP